MPKIYTGEYLGNMALEFFRFNPFFLRTAGIQYKIVNTETLFQELTEEAMFYSIRGYVYFSQDSICLSK